MKRSVVIILALLTAVSSASEVDEIVKPYYTDPLVVKRIYESIKAVNFAEVSAFDDFKREGNSFTLIKSKKAIVTFQSSRLKNLFEQLNNREFFLKLLSRASAFGIETGRISRSTENGETELAGYEGRVLIILHGAGADEEFMVFLAGN
jgi:hypothetical protein